MKDEDFKLMGVLISDRQMDKQMDTCNCRVTFATENSYWLSWSHFWSNWG